ncbi:FeoB-associated Cys-rich membrane protein [Flavonifractor hominis]|uniref:FeoB-associated Cys-rich membrane protein n=1 Tax=Flavonifractor hominis TaxID=3133178 RepID=A0ABV1ER58_9FIRM
MNLPTLLIALAVLAVFVAIVARGIHNRRAGRSSCSCGGSCGHCGCGELCHPKKS